MKANFETIQEWPHSMKLSDKEAKMHAKKQTSATEMEHVNKLSENLEASRSNRLAHERGCF